MSGQNFQVGSLFGILRVHVGRVFGLRIKAAYFGGATWSLAVDLVLDKQGTIYYPGPVFEIPSRRSKPDNPYHVRARN